MKHSNIHVGVAGLHGLVNLGQRFWARLAGGFTVVGSVGVI